MQENEKQEKEKALQKGHVMPDDTPHMAVIVEGGWRKRTYGHGYNAASGVVSEASKRTIMQELNCPEMLPYQKFRDCVRKTFMMSLLKFVTSVIARIQF
ncbi:unnamed protein product [Acanthoscelides obtectus]|uniref:Mutator-like transposase domain-containing protein n=1 Tax=Acanthoscelides obtectus TaxID=200917 RepID=A0A9P0LIB2_ACAOB|nr:unnamed protein product [Acanthoscelides obtectus]CAK1624153.1 hypothetical protein AOBTE_LOCUS2353 [Acanthoscelides obtectus]